MTSSLQKSSKTIGKLLVHLQHIGWALLWIILMDAMYLILLWVLVLQIGLITEWQFTIENESKANLLDEKE